jgi:hypothetical protein
MTKFRTLLVTAEKVADWSLRADRLDQTLTGAGYSYVFADFGEPGEAPDDLRRLVASIVTTYTCQVTSQSVAMRTNNGQVEVTPWRHPLDPSMS